MAASEAGKLDEVWRDVVKLRQMMSENADFAAYLANPLWSDDDKTDVLHKSAKLLGLSNDTKNCLQLVVENRRISDLTLILEEFDDLYYAKADVAEVVVESANKISKPQSDKLQKVLEKLLAKKVVVDYRLNSAILGGLRIKSGSKMFDNSLVSKLNYLENIMKGK